MLENPTTNLFDFYLSPFFTIFPMKNLVFVFVLFLSTFGLMAQTFSTAQGGVNFTSAISAMKGNNYGATVDVTVSATQTTISGTVPMADFQISNTTQKRQFNTAFATATNADATFSGTLNGFTTANLSSDGTKSATFSGTLTIKGMSKTGTLPCSVVVEGGKITKITASNGLSLDDFNISQETMNVEKLNVDAILVGFE